MMVGSKAVWTDGRSGVTTLGIVTAEQKVLTWEFVEAGRMAVLKVD